MKGFIAIAFLAVAAAAPQYPKPAYPEYKPAYKADYKQDYAPKPYDFAWAVKDDYTYNDYKHQETSDDKGYVKGSYQTLLPDGRVQTVSYTADDYTGYVADVQYSGEAKYDYKPAYKPSYPAPEYKAPAYPTPSYPAPAYKAPAYQAPAYQAPAYKAPAYQAPAYNAPAYPAYKAPSYPSYTPSYPAPKY